MGRTSGGSWAALLVVLAGALLAGVGCASSGIVKPSMEPAGAAPTATSDAEPPRQIAQASGEDGSDRVILDLSIASETEPVIEEYDPWMPFNEGTFAFNRQVDRYVLKPAATAWNKIMPGPVQRSLKNAIENLGMPRRLVNNVLQGEGGGAAREVGRFLINSTLGVGGLFDVAKSVFALEASDRDTGQTLGVWGVEPGPYLVLPILPPLTVRDGFGAVVDLALDPLTYFLPFVALAGMTGGKTVNERSLNLEMYQSVEEGAVDMYSAVRNAYLQRRQKQIRE